MRDAILESGFCVRNGKVGVAQEWLQFQLTQAPMILVGFYGNALAGFLLAFAYAKIYEEYKKDARSLLHTRYDLSFT